MTTRLMVNKFGDVHREGPLCVNHGCVPIYNRVASALLRWLVKSKCTQSRLAQMMGVNRGRVYDILKRNRCISPDTALKIERATGLNACYLLMEQALDQLAEARRRVK